MKQITDIENIINRLTEVEVEKVGFDEKKLTDFEKLMAVKKGRMDPEVFEDDYYAHYGGLVYEIDEEGIWVDLEMGDRDKKDISDHFDMEDWDFSVFQDMIEDNWRYTDYEPFDCYNAREEWVEGYGLTALGEKNILLLAEYFDWISPEISKDIRDLLKKDPGLQGTQYHSDWQNLALRMDEAPLGYPLVDAILDEYCYAINPAMIEATAKDVRNTWSDLLTKYGATNWFEKDTIKNFLIPLEDMIYIYYKQNKQKSGDTIEEMVQQFLVEIGSTFGNIHEWWWESDYYPQFVEKYNEYATPFLEKAIKRIEESTNGEEIKEIHKKLELHDIKMNQKIQPKGAPYSMTLIKFDPKKLDFHVRIDPEKAYMKKTPDSKWSTMTDPVSGDKIGYYAYNTVRMKVDDIINKVINPELQIDGTGYYFPVDYGEYKGYGSNINESVKTLNEQRLEQQDREVEINKFIGFCKDELGINELPPVNLRHEKSGGEDYSDIDTTAYQSKDQGVHVYVKDRALVDILRSIAHELVHHHQLERDEDYYWKHIQDNPGIQSGTDLEDEANARAGSLIKDWGLVHGNKQIYEGRLIQEHRLHPASFRDRIEDEEETMLNVEVEVLHKYLNKRREELKEIFRAQLEEIRFYENAIEEQVEEGFAKDRDEWFEEYGNIGEDPYHEIGNTMEQIEEDLEKVGILDDNYDRRHTNYYVDEWLEDLIKEIDKDFYITELGGVELEYLNMGGSPIDEDLTNWAYDGEKLGPIKEDVVHEMSVEDFNDVGEALRNPKKAKEIYSLLLQMFPEQKEVIDYNYKNDAFAEMKRIIHGIDKYKLIGPVDVQPKEMKLDPEVEDEREKTYQQFVKGEIDKYFRTDKTDPRKVDVSKFPPITMDEEGFVSDGNHRAFIAKKQNKPLKAYRYTAAKNDHPNVAKILKLVGRSLDERVSLREGYDHDEFTEQETSIMNRIAKRFNYDELKQIAEQGEMTKQDLIQKYLAFTKLFGVVATQGASAIEYGRIWARWIVDNWDLHIGNVDSPDFSSLIGTTGEGKAYLEEFTVTGHEDVWEKAYREGSVEMYGFHEDEVYDYAGDNFWEYDPDMETVDWGDSETEHFTIHDVQPQGHTIRINEQSIDISEIPPEELSPELELGDRVYAWDLLDDTSGSFQSELMGIVVDILEPETSNKKYYDIETKRGDNVVLFLSDKFIKLPKKQLNEHEVEDLETQVFRFVRPIDIEKDLSHQEIQKVLKSLGLKYDMFATTDINLEKDMIEDLRNQIRFDNFYKRMIAATDIRGGTWEGLFAGLFNGKVVAGQSGVGKADVRTPEGGWSLKFLANKNEAPVLGSLKTQLAQAKEEGLVGEDATIYGIFNTPDNQTSSELFEAKHHILDSAFKGVDFIAVAYPLPEQNTLIMHFTDIDDLKEIIIDSENPPINKPKAGPEALGELRLSARGWKQFPFLQITFPEATSEKYEEYLKKYPREKEIEGVFGKYGEKIPPEVLKYVRKNPKTIIDRLRSIPGYEKYFTEQFINSAEYLTQNANERLKSFKKFLLEKCNIKDVPTTVGFVPREDWEEGIIDVYSRCWYKPTSKGVEGAFGDLADKTFERFPTEEFPNIKEKVDEIYETSKTVYDYILPPGDEDAKYSLRNVEQEDAPQTIYKELKELVEEAEKVETMVETSTEQEHLDYLQEILSRIELVRDIFTSSIGEPVKRRVGFRS